MKNSIQLSQPMPLSKENEISSVQWRIWERQAIQAGRAQEWDKRGGCSITDYEAWLLHERDGWSFQQIGNKFFPKDAVPENRKRKADLAHDRVESEFGRGHRKRRTPELEFYLTTYGVLPRNFAHSHKEK